MTKLSDAQFGALITMKEHGPITAVEVCGPRGMDGKRKVKLECHLISAATLARLEAEGLVTVSRTPLPRPKNAVGKLGNPRRQLKLTATAKGLSALAAEMESA